MRLNKPQFWDEKRGLLSSILLPLSLLIQIIIKIKKKFTKTLEFKIPVICVGNIYVGGTGKTPLTIFINEELTQRGKKTVIIKKFYKEQLDEQNLIRNYSKNLILDKSRNIALTEAEKKNYDIAILDDGYQDYSIKKNLNIICFNSRQLVGNGYTFPSGPLREKLSSITKNSIILINGEKNPEFEKKLLNLKKDISIFYSNYKLFGVENLKYNKLLAFAGIGNPVNFFKLLQENSLNVVKELKFPDHYNFKKKDLEKIINLAKDLNCDLITTEKDFFRIKHYNLDMIKYAKVKLYIDNKEDFLKKIFSKI